MPVFTVCTSMGAQICTKSILLLDESLIVPPTLGFRDSGTIHILPGFIYNRIRVAMTFISSDWNHITFHFLFYVYITITYVLCTVYFPKKTCHCGDMSRA